MIRGALFMTVVAVMLASCSEHARDYPAGGACCVYDPVKHFSTLYDCVDDADCVSGTACIDKADLGGAEILDGWPHSTNAHHSACQATREGVEKPLGDKVCTVPVARTGARQALTHGFHVPAFTLHPTTSDGRPDPSAYTFEAPPETSVVECALFACRPAVRETHTDKEGRDYLAIVNYDQCVVAREIFSPGSGIFDLRNQDLEYHAPAGTSASENPGDACVRFQSRRIAELSVGCWAFDSTEVIGATPLLPIDGRQVFNYQNAFASCADASEGGKACFVDGTSRIGACQAGKCRDICVDNHDCQSAASTGTAGDTISGDAGAVEAGAVEAGALDAAADAGPCNGGPSFWLDAGSGGSSRRVCIPRHKPSASFLCQKLQDTVPPTLMGADPNFVGVCVPSGG